MNQSKQLQLLFPLCKRLRLTPVYEHLNELMECPENLKMSHIDLLYALLNAEVDRRESNAIKRRLKESKSPIMDAALSDIDFSPDRKLDESLIKNLSNCDWIRKHQNCIIIGKTGCGKTWLAGAFVNAACCLGFSAYFIRFPALLNELRDLSTLPNEKHKFVRMLCNIDLLILDDWGLGNLDDLTRSDLLEIIENRKGKGSTLVTSVYPVKSWAALIQNPSYADSILDRLVHNAHRIEIDGPSMRSKPKYGAVRPNKP